MSEILIPSISVVFNGYMNSLTVTETNRFYMPYTLAAMSASIGSSDIAAGDITFTLENGTTAQAETLTITSGNQYVINNFSSAFNVGAGESLIVKVGSNSADISNPTLVIVNPNVLNQSISASLSGYMNRTTISEINRFYMPYALTAMSASIGSSDIAAGDITFTLENGTTAQTETLTITSGNQYVINNFSSTFSVGVGEAFIIKVSPNSAGISNPTLIISQIET